MCRRRPCGMAINILVDLINWLGKPQVFLEYCFDKNPNLSFYIGVAYPKRCGAFHDIPYTLQYVTHVGKKKGGLEKIPFCGKSEKWSGKTKFLTFLVVPPFRPPSTGVEAPDAACLAGLKYRLDECMMFPVPVSTRQNR